MKPEQVWQQFCEKVQKDELRAEDWRSPVGDLIEKLAASEKGDEFRGALKFIAQQPMPPWELAGNKLIFTVPTGEGFQIRLDFLLEDDRWYLFLFEGITIPVKEIPSVPFSDFPGLPRWESWMREELAVSAQVRLFVRLAEEKGRQEAMEWFRDGRGYCIGAQAWVPHFPAHLAFVVYACWIEKHVHGVDTVLEEFTDDRCVIGFKDHIWFQLYERTGHLRPQISKEHYREFFEFIWRDRAKESGWQVSFEYNDHDVTLVLVRQSRAD